MNNIQELRAAYEAATCGEWDYVVADNAERPFCSVVSRDGEGYEESVIATTNSCDAHEQNDAHLIALMHNNLPALLEAAEALKEVKRITRAAIESDGEVFLHETDVLDTIDPVLEKLR